MVCGLPFFCLVLTLLLLSTQDVFKVIQMPLLSQPLLPLSLSFYSDLIVATYRIQNRAYHKENKPMLKQQDGEERRVNENREKASKFRIIYQMKNLCRRE